jgi:hypothetical protein
MTDQPTGSDWQPVELDAIVGDYFDMLAADLAGMPYVKSRHRAALVEKIGRTNGSIEFKHQNISAVLDALGLPWITGYKPARNYQHAIFDAIERQLKIRPELLFHAPEVPPAMPLLPDDVFVPSPEVQTRDKAMPERLRRLVGKFDPVERDHRNRALGKAGEAFVLDIEKRRLAKAARPDLARQVRWVADEDGDGAGYDVLSFHPSGEKRMIEVKTTNGSSRTPFFLSRNECAVAESEPEGWRIYRVHLFATGPRIFVISPPLDLSLTLTAETWRASF